MTFCEVSSKAQTQAIALDRQIGKLLWVFALYSDRPQLRLFAETEDDRFVMLECDFLLANLAATSQPQFVFQAMSRRVLSRFNSETSL